MWDWFDPELRRQLDSIKQMVALRHKTPTREWPLVFVDQFEELLVVREWPDGSITAYSTSDIGHHQKASGIVLLKPPARPARISVSRR